MATLTQAAASIKSITTDYIEGTFVESHGRQVTDIIRPTDERLIARVTLADEEDTRRAIAAARRACATYSRSTQRSARRFCADCMRQLLNYQGILRLLQDSKRLLAHRKHRATPVAKLQEFFGRHL